MSVVGRRLRGAEQSGSWRAGQLDLPVKRAKPQERILRESVFGASVGCKADTLLDVGYESR